MVRKNKQANLKFYTTNEIAEMLKMNVQVIARKLQHGDIIGYKIGKDWRVKEVDLMAWLEKHSNKNVMSESQKVIGRFMKDGRFDQLPAQRKKRKYILEHILKEFMPGKVYDESDVDDIIRRYHDDYCRVRRDFIDERMMYRHEGKYRRNSGYHFIGES